MLLLLPHGTPGLVAVGVSDTALLSIAGDDTNDIAIETIDTARLALTDGGVQTLVTALNRSEFVGLLLADVASVQVSGGPTAIAAADTASIQLTELASVLRDPALIAGTETASLTLAELTQLSVALAVTDTTSLSLSDGGVIDGAASKLAADTCSLSLTDAGAVVADDSTKTPNETARLASAEVAQVAIAIAGTETANIQLAESAALLQDSATVLASDSARISAGEAIVLLDARAVSDAASLQLADLGASSVVADVVNTVGDLARVRLEDRGMRRVAHPVDLIVFKFQEDFIAFRL